jgi:hypothetical protein
MEGMNESYSHSSFSIATAPAEQRLSNFSHPKISLGFEFMYVFTRLDFINWRYQTLKLAWVKLNLENNQRLVH